jgi:hypothetical protein
MSKTQYFSDWQKRYSVSTKLVIIIPTLLFLSACDEITALYERDYSHLSAKGGKRDQNNVFQNEASNDGLEKTKLTLSCNLEQEETFVTKYGTKEGNIKKTTITVEIVDHEEPIGGGQVYKSRAISIGNSGDPISHYLEAPDASPKPGGYVRSDIDFSDDSKYRFRKSILNGEYQTLEINRLTGTLSYSSRMDTPFGTIRYEVWGECQEKTEQKF